MTALTIHEIPSPRCWRLSDPTSLHGFRLEMQLTDHGPGQGTLTIRHDGDSWTHYWSAMGSETIMQFLANSHVDYVVTKLAPCLDAEIVDWEGVRSLLKQKLPERVKTDDTYNFYDLKSDLDDLDNADDIDLKGRLGYRLLGLVFGHFDITEWELPKIPNPEYQRLERLVSMCINACNALLKQHQET